eukprot:TRINITY_DN4918_c0_g1_i6.p1 TRINITY_DN4918_c0_g1~~TRINITY_DN4918_c0_g1_i6.p1  ORF type:complete len:257 (-),score=24.01 TRINITY_DN4918_c0_g1_i6:43-813(-)
MGEWSKASIDFEKRLLSLSSEDVILPLPSGIDPKTAALTVKHSTVAYQAVFTKGRVIEGESVLMINPIRNILALELASLQGARITVLTLSVDEVSLLKKLQGSYKFDIFTFSQSNLKEVVTNLYEEVGGTGFDCIIDFSSGQDDIRKVLLLELLAPNGRVVITQYDGFQLDPPQISALFLKSANIHFCSEHTWLLSGELGKYLTVVEDSLLRLSKDEFKLPIDQIYDLKSAQTSLRNSQQPILVTLKDNPISSKLI